MKEKRYFCDRTLITNQWKGKVSSLIIVTLLASIVLYNLDMKYGVQFGEYSEEVYERLEEIADSVIEENVINLDAMLDSVSDYEVTYKYGVLTFKCSINNYEGNELYPSPSITVTESSGVVKKEHYVSSEEEYIRIQKRSQILLYVLLGMFIWCAGFIVVLAVRVILCGISYIHKKIDTKRKPS